MSDKKKKFPSIPPEKRKEAFLGSLTLFLVLFVVSGILSGLSALIAPVISDMYEDEITEIFERIVPADSYEEIAYDFSAANKVDSAHTALLDGKPVGYCVEIKAREKKSVELRLIVGVSLEGNALAVEVVEMSEEMEYIRGDISSELLNVLKKKNESLAADSSAQAPVSSDPTESQELINSAVNTAVSAISEYTKAKKSESEERAKEAIAAGVNARPSETVIEIPEKEAHGASLGADVASGENPAEEEAEVE